MLSKKIVFIFIFSLILFSCHFHFYRVSDAQIQNFEKWKLDRVNSLKQPFGWLSLAGLYWVKTDTIQIGTNSGFDINFPYDTSVNLGSILKSDNGWRFSPVQKNFIKVEGQYVNNEINLKDDLSGTPTILNYESLFFYMIKRENNDGVRLKDTLNKQRLDFTSIPMFDYEPKYQTKAKVIRAGAKDSILITNAQGVVSNIPLMGWLEFKYKKKPFRLAGTHGGDQTWFIVFGDETNSGETYGAGRFLYVKVPDNSGEIILDFNRAKNPPCYFTEFATCPLPPKQNKLPFEVRAGEKSSHN